MPRRSEQEVEEEREEERKMHGEAQFIIYFLHICWVPSPGQGGCWQWKYSDKIHTFEELPVEFQNKVTLDKCSV